MMGRYQLLRSDLGNQVSHGQGVKGWAAGPDTVWTTEQPKDLKPDRQEKMRGSPKPQGWSFRHGRCCNEWINKRTKKLL